MLDTAETGLGGLPLSTQALEKGKGAGFIPALPIILRNVTSTRYDHDDVFRILHLSPFTPRYDFIIDRRFQLTVFDSNSV